MNSGDKLIVGLGNPGSRYEDTWHNLGANAVSEIAKRWNVPLKPGKGDFLLGEKKSATEKITLMLPTSFMNRSGGPVAGWTRYYKLDLDNVIVVLDDHDLPFGSIRLKPGGSAAGHKGLQDIICRLNTDAIPRLRIGITTELEYRDLSRQVLTKIPASLSWEIEKIVSAAADCLEKMLHDGILSAMNMYNGLNILGDPVEDVT